MVIKIPEGVYTIQTKGSIIKSDARAYKKAGRKLKKKILDELEKTTHLHRKYLINLLNKTGKVYYTAQGMKLIGDPTITHLHPRGRKKKYTQELLPYLKALWVLSGYRSSIHLEAFITEHQSWVLAGIPSEPKMKLVINHIMSAMLWLYHRIMFRSLPRSPVNLPWHRCREILCCIRPRLPLMGLNVSVRISFLRKIRQPPGCSM